MNENFVPPLNSRRAILGVGLAVAALPLAGARAAQGTKIEVWKDATLGLVERT
jgi:hypothetical protein